MHRSKFNKFKFSRKEFPWSPEAKSLVDLRVEQGV